MSIYWGFFVVEWAALLTLMDLQKKGKNQQKIRVKLDRMSDEDLRKRTGDRNKCEVRVVAQQILKEREYLAP